MKPSRLTKRIKRPKKVRTTSVLLHNSDRLLFPLAVCRRVWAAKKLDVRMYTVDLNDGDNDLVGCFEPFDYSNEIEINDVYYRCRASGEICHKATEGYNMVSIFVTSDVDPLEFILRSKTHAQRRRRLSLVRYNNGATGELSDPGYAFGFNRSDPVAVKVIRKMQSEMDELVKITPGGSNGLPIETQELQSWLECVGIVQIPVNAYWSVEYGGEDGGGEVVVENHRVWEA